MKKSLILSLLLVIILGVTAGCEKEKMDDTYINEKFGFTFEFPEIWKEEKDKVKIIEEDSAVTFAYPFTCDELDPRGELMYQDFFTIALMSKEEYEEELNNPPVVSNFIRENDGQVYVIYTPLDNIILEKETQEEYNELHLSLEEIIERFSLMVSNEEVLISVDEILPTPYNELITSLKTMGFNVNEEDVGEDILQGQRKWLTINDKDHISVYIYDSDEKMEEDASYIHEGGSSYNNGKHATEISWASYPHFFKKDNIIVLYVGENLEIIDGLKEIVGPQFAGYKE